MKYLVALTGIVCAVAGCATQDALRQTEAQQGKAVQALRAGADRSDSALSTSREFLANLLAAREEQRRQLDANGVAFSIWIHESGN